MDPLKGDASGFPKTNASSLEMTEQVSEAITTAESRSATGAPTPKRGDPVRGSRSQHSISAFVPSSAESQYRGAVSKCLGEEHLASGTGKTPRLVGLLMVAVCLLSASLLPGHRSQKTGKNQNDRETTAEPKQLEPSKSSTILSFIPDRSLDLPAYVLQVGAMVHEENANALAESLSQTNIPAFVFKRPADRFHYVVVGPYNGADATISAKKEIEKRGFKVIRKEWRQLLQ
jgi:septal ring-binding cell division protein DamX